MFETFYNKMLRKIDVEESQWLSAFTDMEHRM